MKGQSTFELLVTVGAILGFSIPVLFLLLSVTSIGYEDTAKAQADASARTIADSMNAVYAQEDGVARRDILINVPATTESIVASNYEVVVKIRTGSGTFEAAAPTIANTPPGQQLIQKTGLVRMVICKDASGKVKLIDYVGWTGGC